VNQARKVKEKIWGFTDIKKYLGEQAKIWFRSYSQSSVPRGRWGVTRLESEEKKKPPVVEQHRSSSAQENEAVNGCDKKDAWGRSTRIVGHRDKQLGAADELQVKSDRERRP